MGRRADPPGVQEAKGNPGKRRGAAAKRDALLAKVTSMLTAPARAGRVEPQPWLLQPENTAALAVWNNLAPELVRTHRLPEETRPLFAIWCAQYAEWVTAQLDIAENGYTQRVKTVAGGTMERARPVYAVRENAYDNLMKGAERYGLTPRDLYALFKDQAAAAASSPGLFGDLDQGNAGGQQAGLEAAAPVAGGLIGAAGRLRTPPPGSRPN